MLNEGMLFRACQADKVLGVDRHGDIHFVVNAVKVLDKLLSLIIWQLEATTAVAASSLSHFSILYYL